MAHPTFQHSSIPIGTMYHEEPAGTFGVIAEFATSEALVEAARRTHEEGYEEFDAYSPIPVHGLHEAMGRKRTTLPWTVLIMGIIGGCSGFALQYWVSVVAYPVVVGGKPFYSWPAFVPVTFECTILFAGLTCLFAMLAKNGLPLHHHPIFNAPEFERASNDSFFLCIEAADKKFDVTQVKSFLESLGGKNVNEVEG